MANISVRLNEQEEEYLKHMPSLWMKHFLHFLKRLY